MRERRARSMILVCSAQDASSRIFQGYFVAKENEVSTRQAEESTRSASRMLQNGVCLLLAFEAYVCETILALRLGSFIERNASSSKIHDLVRMHIPAETFRSHNT